jgi:hypothetical protein
MIRHPIYIALCISAIAYTAVANARGWDFFQSVTRPFSSTGGSGARSGYHGGFSHK